MNKRTLRIIILIVVIILLLLIVAYFLFMYKFPGSVVPQATGKPSTAQTANTALPGAASVPTAPAPAKPSVPPASSETITKTNLVKIAESFAERLGSYSNQSNFSNISDLKLLMTPSMQSWADKYIAANRTAAYSGVYQGVTTHAITATVIDFNDAQGKADILAHTQKVAQTGTSSPVVTYQDITITFAKQGGEWLVDNAVWKK